MSGKPRVGEILVQAGVIDEMQLASALGEQTRWGRRLGVTLIKMGMVEEGHLIRALAKQLDLPVASLEGKRIADDVVALVPKRVASEHGVMPLFVKQEGSKDQLFLGMEDPSNIAVLDDLTFRTGMQVFPVMVGPSELGAAIDRYYLSNSSSTAADPATEDPIGEISLCVVADGGDPKSSESLVQSMATEASPVPDSLSAREVEFELRDPVPVLPEGLVEAVARAIEETEKTRDVAKAIAHLLIEKGVLSLEELQAQIAQQKGGDSS
jgi:type IV pilus assembly protein PilB